MYKNFPFSSPKKHHRRPNLVFCGVVVNNEINCLTSNKTLYNVEHTLVDNFISNNQIGTSMVMGTTSNAVSASELLFYSDTNTFYLKDGTITTMSAGMNTTNSNGIFNSTNKPIVERIVTATGKYTFKHGYVVTKVVDATKRKMYVYFTHSQ